MQEKSDIEFLIKIIQNIDNELPSGLDGFISEEDQERYYNLVEKYNN